MESGQWVGSQSLHARPGGLDGRGPESVVFRFATNEHVVRVHAFPVVAAPATDLQPVEGCEGDGHAIAQQQCDAGDIDPVATDGDLDGVSKPAVATLTAGLVNDVGLEPRLVDVRELQFLVKPQATATEIARLRGALWASWSGSSPSKPGDRSWQS